MRSGPKPGLGSSRDPPAPQSTRRRRYREWKGGYRSYDLVKEFSIALGVVLAITLLLTILFSSPDEKSTTIKQWSRSDPVDFVTTAVSELDGTSGTATYGPPYNDSGPGQHEWVIHLQKWLGVSHPINTARDYVLAPLSSITGQPQLKRALSSYESAPSKERNAWTSAYSDAVGKAKVGPGDSITVALGNYGPVATMMNSC